MNLLDNADFFCNMIIQHIKGRKAVVLSFDKSDRAKYERKFLDCGIVPEYWIEEIKGLMQEGQAGRQQLAHRSKEYYVVILKNYVSDIKKWMNENGYRDPFDFLFLSPQPKEICGSGLINYSDEHGNQITNLPNNLKIILQGYGSRISFGEEVVFGKNSFIRCGSGADVCIGSYARFGEEVKIIALVNSNIKIEKPIAFGTNSSVKAGDNARVYIGINSRISQNVRIVADFNGCIEIGQEFLAADLMVIRATDGHGIFDVKTGKKQNYILDDTIRNSVVIGNHTWGGYDSMICSPAFIGSGCIVGAKSFVKGRYSNNCIIAGIPAKTIRENCAWIGSPTVDDIALIPSQYAVPTIHKEEISESLRCLTEIENYFQYVDMLAHTRNKIVLIAVKDTIGCKFTDVCQRAVEQCGLRIHLAGKNHCAYIGVLDDEKLLYEKISEIDGFLEKELCIAEIKICIRSKSLLAGNKAEIIVDGYDYSVNGRGFNIVVIDKLSNKIVDSVNFDTHVEGYSCLRKLISY